MTTEQQCSAYMLKRFRREFTNGMEFWTSEDGSLVSIAVCFSSDWKKKLQALVRVRNNGKKFEPRRIKVRYAFREWAESEFWYYSGTKGKVWRIGDSVTPFRVYEYQLL